MSDHALVVVCWPLGPEAMLGRVVFTPGGLSTVRKNVASVVAALKDELERGEGFLPREVENPQIKRLSIEVRPTLTMGKGKKKENLGAGDAVLLPVDVVFGELAPGIRLCEIINFSHLFYLRGADKLESLVEHFVRDAAARMSPEALFRQLLSPAPQLALGTIRGRIRNSASARLETPRISAITERITGLPPGWPGIWERDREVAEVEKFLQGRGSFLVTGERRVGRSSVILEAARKLKKKVKLFRTQSQRLTAGARYLGEWQELCDQLVAELVEAEGILWIEDLVRIFSVGGRSVEDSVGAYLAPRLKEGLRLVGEVTQAESQAIQRLMPSFFDSFEKLKIEPLSQERLQEVIGHVSEHFAINQRVQVEPAAQKLAIRLLDRFIRQEHFPGKAVQFLGDVVREQCSQEGRPPAKIQQIIQAFTRKTGMPAILVDDQLPLLPDSLLSWLEKKISGQPQALQSLVRVILAFKAGLNDPSRPVGVLLFAGPTGVGKTACARAIAEWAFGSEKALIRVDMSECQHPAALARLIGTPGGEPGELVRRVREKPFGVVLLDEVEKAHPAFFDTLLTVLDEGSLTDAFGRTTDFRGCLVILTTNLGAKRGGSLGFHEGVQGLDMGAITRFFRPEFLNRLDQVVPFSPLSLESVRTIAEQELALVAARPGFAGRNIQLLFSDAVVDRVVRAGFDPLLGARPLQRAVEQLVVASLAAWLLDHPGEGKVLVVDEKDGAIVVG